MSTLDDLERFIPELDKVHEKTSRWTVGMQIHHSLRATRAIAESVVASEPGAEKPSFSLPRTVVMTLGFIPRHVGKAPKESVPDHQPTEQELREMVPAAREALEKAAQADPSAFWRHFKFGVMPRDKAIKFIHIHNRHHLKIIRDILARSK